MLDLDSLAEKCAEAHNEKHETWRHVVWGVNFQKLVQHMSDGEIESLLGSCTSAAKLESALHFLLNHPEFAKHSPYDILQMECKEKGISVRQWMASLPDQVR